MNVKANVEGSSGDTFRVVLEGKYLDGFDPRTVQADLARLTRLSESAIVLLFAGRQTTVKSGTDKISGDRYLKALLAIGVACHLKLETLEFDAIPEPAIPSTPTTKPSKATDIPHRQVIPPGISPMANAEKNAPCEREFTIERWFAALGRGKIIGWVLGVFFLLFGITIFFEINKSGFLVVFDSLILIGASLLLLPPARNYAYEKTGITIPLWLRAGLICLALFSIGFIQNSIEERANAKRVQSIERLIDLGRGEEALSKIGEWESSKVINRADQQYDSLRIKARTEIVKEHCKASAVDELKSLADSNNLAGLTNLKNRCGKFVAAIAPVVEKKRSEDQLRVEMFLKNVFKEGEIFARVAFESVLRNQLPGAIQRPLGTGIYWVPIGNEFARIEIETVSGEPVLQVKIASVTRRSRMPQEASYYTSISFDTSEAELTKKFPEVGCIEMPNPVVRMCSVDMEKADSVTFLFYSGKLININGRVRPGLRD